MSEILRTIDKIEQLVENGKGWMGKRLVDEEEFFTLIQQLRSGLPRAMKDAEGLIAKGESVDLQTRSGSPRVHEIIVQSRDLTSQEQLQIVAALAKRLAGE
jgi:hypothetical protein